MPPGSVASPAKPVPQRYHPALVVLHWLILILIFATASFALAGGEEGRGQFNVNIAGLPPIGIHMILGLIVLGLLVIRLAIRIFTPHPSWATTGNRFLDAVGLITHWGLYFLAFSITITGLILALQTNRLARVFNPASVPSGQFSFRQQPPGQIPQGGSVQPGQGQVQRQFPRGQDRPGGFEGGFEGRFSRRGGFFLGAFHGLSWTLLLLLLALHVSAALYHQFLRRDRIFGRIWFGRRYA
jgi:cytochrome b561